MKLVRVGRGGNNIDPFFVDLFNVWIWLRNCMKPEFIRLLGQMLHKVHREYHVEIVLEIVHVRANLDPNVCCT